MAIQFIDLCSGIGGFHSGLMATGHYECVGHAEIDPNAAKAYKAIYGEEGGLNYGDLREIDPKQLPDFELLCAGFPCQSFSVAGRRLGFQDTRGTVFFEIARIIAEKRPPFLLLENVPGLKWVFDTGNPVFNDDRSKPEPYPKQNAWEFYQAVKPYIEHIHIKDAVWDARKGEPIYTFPGEGEGYVREILRDLHRSGYTKGVSIEPHIAVVFHDSQVSASAERQYNSYLEYGRELNHIIDELG